MVTAVALVIAAAVTALVVVRRRRPAATPPPPADNPYADDRWQGAGGPGAEWGPGP